MRLAAAVLPIVAAEYAVAGAADTTPKPAVSEQSSEVSDLSKFLDRLMLAESGGHDHAANPRSSAIGPFQFIKTTFIDVARRRFPREMSELSDAEVLELRTDRSFARAAAAAYTLENAAALKAQGIVASLPNLRLAFLLGASSATRVLHAAPQKRLSEVLGPSVLRANPFMVVMTATGLIGKATRDVLGKRTVIAVRPDAVPRPAPRVRPGSGTGGTTVTIKVQCNEKLAMCRRWIALHERKAMKAHAAQAPRTNKSHKLTTRVRGAGV